MPDSAGPPCYSPHSRWDGRITLSADALVRLAKSSTSPATTYSSTTHPAAASAAPKTPSANHLANLGELTDDKLELVTRFIDALVAKTRLKTLAGNAS